MGSGNESSVHPLHEKETNFYPTLKRNWGNLCGTVALYMTLLFSTTPLTSCSGDDPVIDNPKPNPNEKPSEQFKCETKCSFLTVEEGTVIEITNNALKIGDKTIFEFQGDISFKLNGRIVKNGDKIESGELIAIHNGTIVGTCTVEVEEIKGPEVNVLKDTVNAFGGVAAKIENNSLKVGEIDVAVWPDGCNVLSCEILDDLGQSVGSIRLGENVSLPENWKIIKLTVINKDGGETTEKIRLVNESILGLENYNPNLEVDQESNLLEGLTLADGVQLNQIRVKYADGTVVVVTNPWLDIPEQPGTVTLEFDLQTNFGGKGIVSKEGLNISPLEWQAPEIPQFDPKKTLRILDDLTSVQKALYSDELYNKIYQRWENIARAMAFRDILKEGSDNVENMNNIRVNMLRETTAGSTHAITERNYLKLLHPEGTDNIQERSQENNSVLVDLIKKVVDEAKKNPKYIYPCALSKGNYADQDEYKRWDLENKILPMFEGVGNVIFFFAGGNSIIWNGKYVDHVYHGSKTLQGDSSVYNGASVSDGKFISAVFGTGDARSSMFPEGFPEDALFGGFPLPYYENEDSRKVGVDTSNHTSELTYITMSEYWLALEVLLGVKPDLTLDEMKTIIRETSDRPTITLGDEQQVLYGINFNKITNYAIEYVVPSNIEVNLADIGDDGIVPIDMGYGITLNGVPGTVVRSEDSGWIAFEKNNMKTINKMDPTNLKRGINPKMMIKSGIDVQDGAVVDGIGYIINHNGEDIGHKKIILTLMNENEGGNSTLTYNYRDGMEIGGEKKGGNE